MKKILITALFAIGMATAVDAQKALPVYLDASKPVEQRVEDALSRMTLHEKTDVIHAQRKFSSGIPWGAYKDERTIKFIAFFVKQPYAEWRGMHIIDAIKWYEQENGLLMEKS